MEPTVAPMVCEVCGAQASALRRGRCWVCYVRWAEARPVGLGARCIVCNDRRRDNLRQVEFQGSWVPLCHNCGTRAVRLTPMPRSLEGLRQQLARDRRWCERRDGKLDDRPRPVDRRKDQRRLDAAAGESEWHDAEQLIIEVSRDEPSQPSAELTCIAIERALELEPEAEQP